MTCDMCCWPNVSLHLQEIEAWLKAQLEELEELEVAEAEKATSEARIDESRARKNEKETIVGLATRITGC